MTVPIDYGEIADWLRVLPFSGVAGEKIAAVVKLCEAQIGKPTCWCGGDPPCTSLDECPTHCRTCRCNA